LNKIILYNNERIKIGDKNARYKRLYKQMKAENRRKEFNPVH
jgi:hypothetical protein